MKIKNLFRLRKNTFINALFVFLFVNYISNCYAAQQPYPYKFNYLTVDEGLSHTDANDVAQDRQGYIWVATFFGLDRFDGYTVKKYYNNNTPLNNAFKNRIMCLYPDDNGNIWLGTESGLQCFDSRLEKYIDFNETGEPRNHTFSKLFKPRGNMLYAFADGQFKVYLINKQTITEQKLTIPVGVQLSDMATSTNGLLYLTSNKGIWILDKNRSLKQIAINNLQDANLTKVSYTKDNQILFAASDKLFLTVKSQNGELYVVKQFSVPDHSFIRDIIQDQKSDYWLNIGTGMLRLDRNLNFIQSVTNKSSQHSLNSNSLTKSFIDRSGCLWIAAFGGGLNYCDLNEKLFYTLQHNPEVSNSLSGNHIRSILEDKDIVWIGTTANGLNRYNFKTKTFTYYNTYNSPVRLKNDAITSLTFDSDHNLWIGSVIGIEILKPDGKSLWRPASADKFPEFAIDALAKDCFGNIWFGDHMNNFGVIWKDKSNIFHVKYYEHGEGYCILADGKSPQLLISSLHGLMRLIIDAEGNIVKTFRYQASSKPNSLSSDYTYPIKKQNDSTYWVGTIGGGLNRLILHSNGSYTIKSYTNSYGVFNDVESLEIDNANNIWMGGNGLECLNPTTEKLIRYDKNDGLQGNSFKVGSSYKGANGRLYFGGINGLNYFYPGQIKANNIASKPVLTDILINNRKPYYGKSDTSENAIDQAIGYCKKLKISYLQNNFVIFFSSMHYANPLKCRYRYQLLGYDKDWKYTNGKNPSAAYSNLDYKQYKFIVEATNNDGTWSKSQAETTLTITPPWWKSDIAKFVYALLIFIALSGIYIYQARWYRLKREIAVREINEKKREEMHKHKEDLYQQQLMFFTNISHEFRTPLTLILGPLESLISQNKDSVLDNSYQLMLRNAKRLINLISELMNFKKVSDSIIKLQVQPLIIKQFCKDLAMEFQSLAINKDIDFKLINHAENDNKLPGWFDVQILEKILFNLLNNSFKYTNVGGQISFEIFFDIKDFKPSFDTGFQLLNEEYRAKKYIYFRIADSGTGISSDSITKIFDRYYRISKNHLGSGVGLALVKSLTQLHKGDIYVYSERYKGTEIIIGIPWNEEDYKESEKATSGQDLEFQLEPIDNSFLSPLPDQENDVDTTIFKLQKHILIVDDNQELRTFLKQTFEKHYYIYEAEDGNAAIEIATQKVPDLIISDVMMPGMNGIELCKLVKERFETSHIPFIILSAKDALDSKISGMESGADFYFAKPLSIDLLLLTVHNIFEQGEKLKERYTNNYLAEATELVQSEKDKEFFHKLLSVIEDNIQDQNLDVDFLCKHLYISRTKLYQKIKSISDQSVGEFIRTVRLKKSIHIMTHEDIAMNEVADRVGLQSSSNFSRSFKKEYGKSPLQFMQSLKKANV
jgi:signal transduction histidine kinase/DNA-binding response OmpR family regulator/ligand-binding sensor domain-containing protein